MFRRQRVLACVFAGLFAAGQAAAAVAVKDDLGNEVRLEHPARRIVSLSPHTTELLFAAGAGPYVVGVSNYSDYPEAAKQIPSVGRIGAVDVERILTLRPDLIVAWHSGNAASQMQKLRAFGIPIFESQPTDYAMIASSLERLAILSNTPEGMKAAADFRTREQALEQTYRSRSPVSVFYQIWSQPLMKLSGKHMASAVLRTCGGANIFADLPQLAPSVSIEAVISADPTAILSPDDTRERPFDQWRRFGKMKAVASGNLFTVHADWMNRPGPRILDATEHVCKILDTVRNKQSVKPVAGNNRKAEDQNSFHQ